MAPANLRRIDTLLELRSALLGFRSSTAGVPASILRHVDELKRRVDAARRQAERDRDRAYQQLASRREGKDGDGGAAAAALHGAERRIAEISALAAQLERARSNFERRMTTWRSVAERIIPRGAHSLQQSAAHAADYLHVRPPGSSGGGSGDLRATAFTSTRPAPVDVHPSRVATAGDLPSLPEGFEWFSIDAFQAADLPGASDPPKGVPEAEMRLGLERLWSEVIPLTQGGGQQDQRARCEQFDREHNRVDRRGFVHPQSVAAIWDAFFNTTTSNQVRIEIDQGGRATIANGRHRIKAARDLGWHFIPAQVIRRA